MELHCNSNVIPMPKSESISVTLPAEAIEMIENGLVPFGLYGTKRATVCSNLILDALKRSEVREQVREGQERSTAAANRKGEAGTA